MNSGLANIPEMSSALSTCLCTLLSWAFLIWIGFMICKWTSKTQYY